MDDYILIDSGDGLKFERFGKYELVRPCAQAVWKPQKPMSLWNNAHAFFTREKGNQWSGCSLPDRWVIQVEGIQFKLSTTDFGHLGIFPEQRPLWAWIKKRIKAENRPLNILNLFAYSGGATFACALAGAQVCHLDASKGMVSWARENAQLNGCESAPIRWIVDDVKKFLVREVKRGVRYDAVILDPPSFGRGTSAEIFKIEKDLIGILEQIRSLLSNNPSFILFSCHTPGYTPITMHQILDQIFSEKKGSIESGEMVLSGSDLTYVVPSGCYARWTSN